MHRLNNITFFKRMVKHYETLQKFEKISFRKENIYPCQVLCSTNFSL